MIIRLSVGEINMHKWYLYVNEYRKNITTEAIHNE